MIGRAATVALGSTMKEVEESINAGDTGAIEQCLDEEFDHVRWTFEPSPSLEDLDAEICAFDEMWGQPPELLVIDSLYNVTTDSDNEWSSLREVGKALHHVARASEAAVLLLHHVSEADGKPTEPAARKAILGKVNQLPEMILTVALDAFRGEFKIAAVKNRSGPADPTGKTYVTLFADPSRMLIADERKTIADAQLRSQWQ